MSASEALPRPCEEPRDRVVTVCASCLRASCWQGIFFCEEARDADTIELPVSRLMKLDLENSQYWKEEEE